MEQVFRQAAVDPFWSLRGKAIQHFANVEQALCGVFSAVSELKPDVAAVIFFRITNPRVVGSMLKELLERKYKDTYSVFWNSLAKLTQEAVETRNKIVHWNVANCIGPEGLQAVTLTPPNFYNLGDMKMLDSSQMEEFTRRCDFIARLYNMFHLFLSRQDIFENDAVRKQLWYETFQQPVVYPPPATHPLLSKPYATAAKGAPDANSSA